MNNPKIKYYFNIIKKINLFAPHPKGSKLIFFTPFRSRFLLGGTNKENQFLKNLIKQIIKSSNIISCYKLITIFYLIFLSFNAFSQSYTASGYIIDEDNGETIIGASIVLKDSYRGVITDNNGFFILTGLSNGTQTLIISHVSYNQKEITITIEQKNVLLDEIKIKPNLYNINEVSIIEMKPEQVGDKEVEISQLELTPKAIQSIPSAKNDVFKAIKYLPGIEGGETFSPLYSARGGDPSENLVMLDGVVMYNPYHFISSSGIFNVQTIKQIDLLVGGFGAEYGGRNSSILYLTTIDGDNSKFQGEIEPTTTHTKAFVEFPTGEKGTMMIAGRYYYDLPGTFLFYSYNWFSDFNLSYTYRINKRNRLTFKTFLSKDKTKNDMKYFFAYFYGTNEIFDIYRDLDVVMNSDWSTNATTAILKTIISPKAYLRTQIYGSFHSSKSYSKMGFTFEIDSMPEKIELFYNTSFSSKIKDFTAKTSLNYKLGNLNNFNIGIEYNYFYFENGANINDFDKGAENRSPTQISVYGEDKIRIGSMILRPGIRTSNYSLFNEWLFEPRVNLLINLPNSFKIKAAWGNYYQYIISMNTQEYEVSQMLDYYYPLKNLKPSQSIHYILGFEKDLFNFSNISVDFYYKEILKTYTFDLNQSELELHNFSDKLQTGTGNAYGAELLFKGNWKQLSGWLSYGYSKSYRSFPHIMNGKKFLFDYNRTHSFKTIVNWQATEKTAYSGSFIYMTGIPKTIERTFQSYYNYDAVTNSYGFYPQPVSNYKNNARLPSVIELDIGLKKEIRTGFGAEAAQFLNLKQSFLNVSIQNVLFFRRNVIWYYGINDEKYLPVGINYFPIISVGYTLKF